jgi:hypothetical protein
MYKLYDEHDIVKFVKFGRLRWAGHVLMKKMTLQGKSFVLNREELEVDKHAKVEMVRRVRVGPRTGWT